MGSKKYEIVRVGSEGDSQTYGVHCIGAVKTGDGLVEIIYLKATKTDLLCG